MSDTQLQEVETPIEPAAIEQKKTRVQLTFFSRMIWRIRRYFARKLSDLTVSQWLYLIAFLLLISSVDQDIEEGSTLLWVGGIAGLGLMRELWHVFNRVWDNMLGKAVVFVLYAATANFAVAISALKVNAIAGIEPFPFVFSIGFATLLMLPFWLLIASLLFFSIALVVGNLWLIVSILLRIIRIKVQVHWEDKSFVFATMILRVVLIPYVIMSVFFMAVPYAEEVQLFKDPVQFLKKAAKNNNESNQATDNASASDLASETSDNAATSELTLSETDVAAGQPQVNITVSDELAAVLNEEREEGIGIFDKLIAFFIYEFETYPYSACKKQPEQKSLIINENSVLLVEKDDSELGYKFMVAACEGNYASTESPDSN